MTRRRLHQVAWLCGVLVIALAVVAIAVGLLRGVATGELAGMARMPMNAAIAALAIGTSLLLLRAPAARPGTARVGRACALFAVAIGIATLVEQVAGVDLGIDQLLVRAPTLVASRSGPGRMATLSALSFVLGGLALVTLDARLRVLRSASQLMTVAVLLIGFSAWTGYALGATAFHAVTGVSAMTIHVVTAMTLFAIAALLSRPQREVIAAFTGASPRAAAIRRSLLLGVATLLAVAILRLAGQWAGLYSAELGSLLAISVCAVFTVSSTMWYAVNARAAVQIRRQALRDERFLFELGDLLRTSARSAEILAQVSVRLGEYLGLARCLFIEIDDAAASSTIRHDHHPGVPSLVAAQPLSAWSPELVAAGRAGRTMVAYDADVAEPGPALGGGGSPPSGIASYVAVPLLRHGSWVATLLASAAKPRPWQPRDVALLQSIAERTWLWFESLVGLEALREREQHLAAVLDNAFDAIVSTDQAGSIVDFNRSAERIFGYRRADVLGRPMAGLLFPASQLDVHRLAPLALDAAGPSVSSGTQLAARRADGTEIAVEISVARVQNSEPPRFTVLIHDVTERRRAMDQLLLAIEAAATGMLLVDRDGKIALVNAQLENLFGYPRDQLVGKPVELLVPHRVSRQHPELRKAFVDDPRFHTMGAGRELFGLHRDGREIPVTIVLNPFHLETGEFVLSSVVDITERKRAEQALRESEERLRMAQQIARIGTFEWNIETGAITWTAQLEAMHGLPPGSFPGTQASWDRLIHHDDHAAVSRSMARAFDSDQVAEAEWRIVWPDGTIRWLAGRWKVFRSDHGKPLRVTGINIDLTERKRVEQDREDLLGQLGALNADLERRVGDRTAELTAALKEREVLLQEVHHRVKNNLQIISSLIRLQIRKIDDPDNRRGLEECRSRVEAIALIHEQLYQAKDYTQVAFSDYVKTLVANVFRAATVVPTVTLAVDIEPIALPVDKAIPCGLILNELMTNALKHAFPGGRSGSVRVDLRQTSDGEVVLAVCDDGVGIAHDLAPGTSTSLGMRLVDMLSKQLRGRFDVIRNNGMTFRIAFPLTDDAAPS